MQKGKIVAVARSFKIHTEQGYNTVRKKVHDRVVFEKYGVQGDEHAGPIRKSYRDPQIAKPNDRQVSMVAIEVIEEVNQKLGIDLKPGDLGENIAVQGLGDLSHVPSGTVIVTGDGNVRLKVTGQNEGCYKLSTYHDKLEEALVGKRGLLLTVIEGEGCVVQTGDTIMIL